MKKRLLLLCVSCCMAAMSHAQSEGAATMLADSPTWQYFMGWWKAGDNGEYTCDSYNKFYTDGTVEKGGKTYHKLYIDVAHLDGSGTVRRIGYSDDDVQAGYLFGMREEAGRVYVDEQEYNDFLRGTGLGNADYVPYERTDGGELVLYDFTMAKGDRFRSVEGYPDVWVTEARDTCTDDNVSRRMLTLSNGTVIVEGIGCVYSAGMLPAYLNPAANAYPDYGTLFAGLSDFRTGEAAVFSMNMEAMAGYNGTASVAAPDATGSRRDGAVYSIDGRRLPDVPQRGIYIQNGKKIMAR